MVGTLVLQGCRPKEEIRWRKQDVTIQLNRNRIQCSRHLVREKVGGGGLAWGFSRLATQGNLPPMNSTSLSSLIGLEVHSLATVFLNWGVAAR